MFKVRNWIGVFSTPIIVTSVGCAVTHQPMANNQRGLTTDRMMTIAKTLERQGHLAQARFAYEQVIAVQPQNSNAHQSLETLIALENQQFQQKQAQQYVPAGNFVVPQQQMVSMAQMTPRALPMTVMPMTSMPTNAMPMSMTPMSSTPMTMVPMTSAPMSSVPMNTVPMNTVQSSNSAMLAPLAQVPAQPMTMRPIQMAPTPTQMHAMQSTIAISQPQMTMVQIPTGMAPAPMQPVQVQMPSVSAPMSTVQASPILMPPALPNAPIPAQLSAVPATVPTASMFGQAGGNPQMSRSAITSQQPLSIPPSPSPMYSPVPALPPAPTQQRTSQARTSSRTFAAAAPSMVVPDLSVTPVALTSSNAIVTESFEPVELPSPSPLETETLPVPEIVIKSAVEHKVTQAERSRDPIRTVVNEVVVVPKEESAVPPCDVEFRLPVVMTTDDPFGNAGKFDPIDERHEEVALDLNQIGDQSLRRFFGEFSAEVIGELKSKRHEYVDPICKLAGDSTKQRELRTRAVFLLGAIGPDAASAVPEMRRSMHHTRDRYLQADFAEAILKIQGSDPDAVEVLVDCLQQPDRGLKLIAAFSLRNVAPSEIPRAIDGLERWIGTEDLKLKRMIYLTLGEFGTAAARAIPYLEAGLENPDPSTRDIAAASLAAIAPNRPRSQRPGSGSDLF